MSFGQQPGMSKRGRPRGRINNREPTNAEVNMPRRVPNFGGRKELRNASTNDLRNALALLKYVHICQRAATSIYTRRSAGSNNESRNWNDLWN